MDRLSDNSVVTVENRSYPFAGEVDVPPDGSSGVLIAQGGRFGGWAVYVHDRCLCFSHNVVGIQRIGTGRVAASQATIFSADETTDETTDVGDESGTTVASDHDAASSRFTGKIHWVQLDVGTDDHDHFISPEERLRVAIARQ